MNNSTKQRISSYMIKSIAGRFVGFILGMWSTGLVSLFVETRNSKNLWGILATKPIISKSTFDELEWWISVIIGFIVSEVVNKYIKEKIKNNSYLNEKVNRYFPPQKVDKN